MLSDLVGLENREVKAYGWDSEDAPRKIDSTQVKRRSNENLLRDQNRGLDRVSGGQEALLGLRAGVACTPSMQSDDIGVKRSKAVS